MGAADYDEFCEAYARHSENSIYNEYYDRPAILELAGDIAAKDVLDVGCAAGHLTRKLIERGARVVAVDSSPGMVRLAKERCAGKGAFHVANLSGPLPFLADSSFDLVTASLVLHYLRDWGPALTELRRVLRADGELVMSVHHPEEWHWFNRWDYFRIEEIRDEICFDGQASMLRFYRRPLGVMFSALRTAGFRVDDIVEPMPLADAAEIDQAQYHVLRTAPRFLYFRAVNPAG